MKTFTVDISLVLDLPETPTDEDVVNAVIHALTKRLAEGTLDGCTALTEEE